jgi:hypothetical protein
MTTPQNYYMFPHSELPIVLEEVRERLHIHDEHNTETHIYIEHGSDYIDNIEYEFCYLIIEKPNNDNLTEFDFLKSYGLMNMSNSIFGTFIHVTLLQEDACHHICNIYTQLYRKKKKHLYNECMKPYQDFLATNEMRFGSSLFVLK